MKEQTREEPTILAAAERNMHAWAMSREREDRFDRHEEESRRAGPPLKFVAISREAGAGGEEIGRRVGERLGWDVHGKSILDDIAEHFHLPRIMLDLVDETHPSWVYDVLGTWMDRKIVPHEKFVAYLTRTVLGAARRGHAVFVGRGAQFLLPRHEVLAVRLVASLSYRVQRVMEKRNMTEVDAKRCILELDDGRRKFVEKFFRRDISDPHNFDLTINVERCGVEGAVDQIVAAVREVKPATVRTHAAI